MKAWWMCAIAWGGVAGAAAPADTVRFLPSPLEMPRRIGPMMLADQPHRYEDPRLGVSYQYNGAGLSLTVYVYDLGIEDIPEGADTNVTCAEFEKAKHDVEGAYQNTQLRSQQLVRLSPPEDVPLAREAVYEYERDNHSTVSYVWLTAVAKNFVKLRFSVDPSLRDELPDARRAVLSTLGSAIKPHLAPPDPQAGKPGTSVAINASGTDDEMASGILYLMFLTAIADKTPESQPLCGGEYVPGFEAELAAYQGMSTLNEAGPKTKFGKRIDEIVKAGFLEEFVWLDLHRESWGATPPAGLALAEYAPWRKKHLKRFRVPRFGRVTIDHPRALTLEPPAP